MWIKFHHIFSSLNSCPLFPPAFPFPFVVFLLSNPSFLLLFVLKELANNSTTQRSPTSCGHANLFIKREPIVSAGHQENTHPSYLVSHIAVSPDSDVVLCLPLLFVSVSVCWFDFFFVCLFICPS